MRRAPSRTISSSTERGLLAASRLSSVTTLFVFTSVSFLPPRRRFRFGNRRIRSTFRLGPNTTSDHLFSEGLLSFYNAFSAAGFIVRDLGLIQWRQTWALRSFPCSFAALSKRHYRDELLLPVLMADEEYLRLHEEKNVLLRQAVAAISQLPCDTAPRRLLDSEGGASVTALIEWGLRESRKQHDPTQPGVNHEEFPERHLRIEKRNAKEVFLEHLYRRRTKRLDPDLEYNYADDVFYHQSRRLLRPCGGQGVCCYCR